jgi:hypothetical protein
LVGVNSIGCNLPVCDNLAETEKLTTDTLKKSQTQDNKDLFKADTLKKSQKQNNEDLFRAKPRRRP